MDNPTHEQMREDLARAMEWTTREPKINGCDVWYAPDNVHEKLPDPFTSAADSRALVMWLNQQPKAVQSKFGRLVAQSVSFSWEFEGENGTCTLWDHLQDGTLYEDHFVGLLAADCKTIALAAWRATQPTKRAG